MGLEKHQSFRFEIVHVTNAFCATDLQQDPWTLAYDFCTATSVEDESTTDETLR